MPAVQKPHLVVAAVLPGTVLLDLAAPAHLFGHCGEGRYRFETVAIHDGATGSHPEGRTVPTTSGLAIVTTADAEILAEADTLLVPGYAGATTTTPPTQLVDALQAAAARGARVMSICTGAFALGHAGLLDGRRAATHWDSADRLAKEFPACEVDPQALYVDEGDVLTSAGVAAGLDLCLHVVRRDHGAQVASAVARRTVIAPHRSGGQAQYLARPLAGGRTGAGASGRAQRDPPASVAEPAERAATLAPTRAWALEHLAGPLDVVRLAAHANVSPRTFARRFVEEVGTTPAKWVADQRVAAALELLEQTDRSVDDVAWACGFGTAATLRAHLRAAARTTPTAYRRTFRGDGGPIEAPARTSAGAPARAAR